MKKIVYCLCVSLTMLFAGSVKAGAQDFGLSIALQVGAALLDEVLDEMGLSGTPVADVLHGVLGSITGDHGEADILRDIYSEDQDYHKKTSQSFDQLRGHNAWVQNQDASRIERLSGLSKTLRNGESALMMFNNINALQANITMTLDKLEFYKGYLEEYGTMEQIMRCANLTKSFQKNTTKLISDTQNAMLTLGTYSRDASAGEVMDVVNGLMKSINYTVSSMGRSFEGGAVYLCQDVVRNNIIDSDNYFRTLEIY